MLIYNGDAKFSHTNIECYWMAVMNSQWNKISPGRPDNIAFRVDMRHTVDNILIAEQNTRTVLFFLFCLAQLPALRTVFWEMFISLATSREENLAFFWMRLWIWLVYILIKDLVILIGFPPACWSSKGAKIQKLST